VIELILAQIWMESSFDPTNLGCWHHYRFNASQVKGAGIDVKYPYEDFTSDPDQYDLILMPRNIQAGNLVFREMKLILEMVM